MVLLVFVAHTFRGRPAIETLLFSIALAVGLSPELLPDILSVNLARGAKMMAGRGLDEATPGEERHSACLRARGDSVWPTSSGMHPK